MSTFYYLCCRTHKIAGPMLVGRSFPDRWWLADYEKLGSVAEFVRDHQSCVVAAHDSLVVLSEYSTDNRGYTRR